jgi:hypothetical protein
MQVKLTLAALTVVAAIGASTPSFAQGLSYGIKFGGGLAMTGTDAQAARAAFNFALTSGWNFRQKDEVFAEFGYRYYKADWADRTLLPNKPEGYGDHNFLTGVGYHPDGQGHIFNVDPSGTSGWTNRGSVDMRKDNIEGWGLSIGYRFNFPDTNFYLHGALMLNVMNYQQEAIGELQVFDSLPTIPASTPAPVLLYREGLNYTPGVHSLSPGFYVGGQWRMDKNFFAELNLSWMNYSTINYNPFVYTGKEAHTSEDKDSKLTVEFNFGFRF